MPDDVYVLKETTCPSLSSTSSITYQIGNTPDGTLHIRLIGNSGNGNFNGYWVPMPKILNLLNDQDEPFSWALLCPLFEGRSVNSACFLMSALKHEGLVQQSKEQPRRYERGDPAKFTAEMKVLMVKTKKGGKKSVETVQLGIPAETTA